MGHGRRKGAPHIRTQKTVLAGHDPAHRTANPWNLTTINGTSIGDAFAQWYAARSGGGASSSAARSVGGASSSAARFRWVAAATTSPTPPDTCGYW